MNLNNLNYEELLIITGGGDPIQVVNSVYDDGSGQGCIKLPFPPKNTFDILTYN